MSIRRIESSYAHFFEDKDSISPSEMSVLIALSYVANEQHNEDCFPSDEYLSRLTHFSSRNVSRIRTKLRERNIITWDAQYFGNARSSNYYKFLFEHKILESRHDTTYKRVALPEFSSSAVINNCEQVADNSSKNDTPPLTPCHPTPDTVSPPPRHCVTTPLTGCLSNSESNSNINRNLNSEEAYLPVDSNFSYSTSIGESVDQSLNDNPTPQLINALADTAMQIARVQSNRDRNAFRKVIRAKYPLQVRDVLYRITSEIKQHKYDNARNMAAIITSELKKLSDRPNANVRTRG